MSFGLITRGLSIMFCFLHSCAKGNLRMNASKETKSTSFFICVLLFRDLQRSTIQKLIFLFYSFVQKFRDRLWNTTFFALVVSVVHAIECW